MKSLLISLFLALFLGIQVTVAQEVPYVPNIRDNRVLEKAEQSLDILAEAGKKENLVQIIGTVKTQLGILTDAKSQYILFSLGRIAEEKLPKAISVVAENNHLPSTENDEEITTGTNEALPPKEDTEVVSGTLVSDLSPEKAYVEEGKASYYASSLEGNHTANGDIFDNNAFTAAHKTLPFNTRIKVTNTKNNLRVIVRINDRGPFTPGRILDLSQAAFKAINNGSLRAGILDVSREFAE